MNFAQKHGAKKEFYDEGHKVPLSRNKSKREYSASIYGLPYQEFPVTAFTNEATYQQWCIRICWDDAPAFARPRIELQTVYG